MPKVSVIIPVYNTEKYLKKCLDSLICQTLSDIEIICINNGSTDNSYKILKEYENKDKRIKLIDFKENKGASIARNKGIDDAEGEYIGFVDSDDFVDLDFYEKLYNKAIEANADAVKGNIYNCDEIGNNSILTEFYDMNDKIRKNSAYFYYGFTSAIYKKAFLNKFEIRFPEKINYFEDPYFSVKACLNYEILETIDGAKYYYVQHNQASRSNHMSITNFKDFEAVGTKIIDLINSTSISEKAYKIVFDFIYNFAYSNSNVSKEKNEFNKFMFNFLARIILSYRYDTEIEGPLFTEIKNEIFKDKFYQELSEEYKKYDYLNIDVKNPLVKILVSYIKPSFLFKSQILTPIHLGRAVESEDSKDGVQSSANLSWLHENCEFNDDFEGGISKYNRRIGFLTGTYWAWKNYEKLGNPKYFGSFGYRKLLFPNCLYDLEKYDLILPKPMKFEGKSLKEQMAECHGENYYKVMIKSIEVLYPNQYEAAIDYFNRNSGYFAEMYIMKRQMFFEFCEWIFSVFKYLICENRQFIAAKETKSQKQERLISDFLGEDVKKLDPAFKKNESRDLAFILERLTGFYMYMQTKNRKNIKYKEINVFEPEATTFAEQYKALMLEKLRKNVKQDRVALV